MRRMSLMRSSLRKRSRHFSRGLEWSRMLCDAANFVH